MYDLIRMSLFVLTALLIVAFVLIAKKAPRALKIIVACILLVLFTVITAYPFENMFISFDSPADAVMYRYNQVPGLCIEGANSVLTRTGTRMDILPVVGGKYKLSPNRSTNLVFNTVFQDIGVTVYKHGFSDDHYINVVYYLKNSQLRTISDSYQSSFVRRDENGFVSFIAFMGSFDENYELYVDGEKIPLEESVYSLK